MAGADGDLDLDPGPEWCSPEGTGRVVVSAVTATVAAAVAAVPVVAAAAAAAAFSSSSSAMFKTSRLALALARCPCSPCGCIREQLEGRSLPLGPVSLALPYYSTATTTTIIDE